MKTGKSMAAVSTAAPVQANSGETLQALLATLSDPKATSKRLNELRTAETDAKAAKDAALAAAKDADARKAAAEQAEREARDQRQALADSSAETEARLQAQRQLQANTEQRLAELSREVETRTTALERAMRAASRANEAMAAFLETMEEK